MKLTDIKRKQVLKAAIDEFRECGFSATSMDNVAAQAQVSKRTVYNHFASKEELFNAIVSYMMTIIEEAVYSVYDPAVPVDQQLREIAYQEIELLKSEEFMGLAKVAIAEAIHSPEKMTNVIEQINLVESSMSKWFLAAADDGKLAITDGNFAVNQFMGLIKPFCFWPQLIKGDKLPDDDQIERIVNCAVDMFLGYYNV